MGASCTHRLSCTACEAAPFKGTTDGDCGNASAEGGCCDNAGYPGQYGCACPPKYEQECRMKDKTNCPVCGSSETTVKESKGHVPVPFSSLQVPFTEEVITCGKCHESIVGDQQGLEAALRVAQALSVKAILSYLKERKCSFTYVERVLHLKAGTLTKWDEVGAVSDAEYALLKIIREYPELLAKADEGGWKDMPVTDIVLNEANSKMLAEALLNPKPNPAVKALFERFKPKIEGKPIPHDLPDNPEVKDYIDFSGKSLDTILNYVKANVLMLIEDVRSITMGHSLVPVDTHLTRIQRACDHIQRNYDKATGTLPGGLKPFPFKITKHPMVCSVCGLEGGCTHLLNENAPLSKEEFTHIYCERSGITPDKMASLGLSVKPCSCGEEGCRGWEMSSQPPTYEETEALLKRLIEHFKLPMPNITPHLRTDPCDYTEAGHIRLNLPAAEGMELYDYVSHVFGHWVADLHTEDAAYADEVADAIGGLVKEKMVALGWMGEL